MGTIIKYVLDKFPHCHKSNTEVCIYTWEEVARRKGLDAIVDDPVWIEMKAIIRDHKPEAITRKRREYTAPTPNQAKEEEHYRQKYS